MVRTKNYGENMKEIISEMYKSGDIFILLFFVSAYVVVIIAYAIYRKHKGGVYDSKQNEKNI